MNNNTEKSEEDTKGKAKGEVKEAAAATPQASPTTSSQPKRHFTLLIDKSGSMTTRDCPNGRSRWELAKDAAKAFAQVCCTFDADHTVDVFFFGTGQRVRVTCAVGAVSESTDGPSREPREGRAHGGEIRERYRGPVRARTDRGHLPGGVPSEGHRTRALRPTGNTPHTHTRTHAHTHTALIDGLVYSTRSW